MELRAIFFADLKALTARKVIDEKQIAEYKNAFGYRNVAFELQRTGAGTPPRIHLDLETDDVAAEVARLEQLGASVTERADGWVVMADPGGMVFCVVPVWTDRADFERHATSWS